MALRVLLADESTTIKRVIQLALQDYAVEVKSVPVGLDVLPVAKSFRPDVVFADILLPKRSGYDVCADLKNESETASIPVILMWSSFMELDGNKADVCRAEGRLEKPFETEQLRSMVQSLVPRLQTNPVSSFLKFPKLPEFAESLPQAQAQAQSQAQAQTQTHSKEQIQFQTETSTPPADTPSFIIEDPHSEIDIPLEYQPADESFQQIPLHKQTGPENTAKSSGWDTKSTPPEESSWAKKDLSEFKLNLEESQPRLIPSLNEYQTDLSRRFETLDISSIPDTNQVGSFEEVIYETPKPGSKNSNLGPTALDMALTEKVVREEAQKMLENIIWKILPDIAERVVREEINKLLQETEKADLR